MKRKALRTLTVLWCNPNITVSQWLLTRPYRPVFCCPLAIAEATWKRSRLSRELPLFILSVHEAPYRTLFGSWHSKYRQCQIRLVLNLVTIASPSILSISKLLFLHHYNMLCIWLSHRTWALVKLWN